MKVSDIIKTTVCRTFGALGVKSERLTEARFLNTDCTATGATKGAAMDALVEELRAHVECAAELPFVVTATPTLCAMLYPRPRGWAYTLICEGRAGGTTLTGETRRECERVVRCHLAQILYGEGLDPELVLRASCIDDDAREGFDGWREWQELYKEAEARGEPDPHRWACEAQNGIRRGA